MYGASTQVTVKAIEPNKRILIEWDGYSGRTAVEWKFASQEKGTTFVSIRSRAGRVMATNLSATCQTPLRGSLGRSQVSKLYLSPTSD